MWRYKKLLSWHAHGAIWIHAATHRHHASISTILSLLNSHLILLNNYGDIWHNLVKLSHIMWNFTLLCQFSHSNTHDSVTIFQLQLKNSQSHVKINVHFDFDITMFAGQSTSAWKTEQCQNLTSPCQIWHSSVVFDITPNLDMSHFPISRWINQMLISQWTFLLIFTYQCLKVQ